MDKIQKATLKRLAKIGWEPAEDLLVNFCPSAYKRLVKEYQKRQGLKPDGVVGGITMRDLEVWRFCGAKEPFGVNQRDCKWPHRTPTYCVTKGAGKFSANDIKDFMGEISDETRAVCNLTLTYTANHKTANIIIFGAPIDGPGGVLADATVPCNAKVDTQLRIRCGTAENYGRFDGPPPRRGMIDFKRMLKHETGHTLGKFHLNTPNNLMNPMYSDHIWDWMPGDIAELVKRYDKPKVEAEPPKPAPTPTEPDRIQRVEFTYLGQSPSSIRVNGKQVSL